MPKISHQLSDRFEETAFSLFFEGNLPTLAAQFRSINIDQSQPPSPRMAFFAALMQPDSKVNLEDLFYLLLAEGDLEACCACVGGALMKIWDKGKDFSLYTPWLERSEKLLQQSQKISALAQAFLLLQKGVAEMTGAADLAKAEQSYSQQQQCAEQAESASLRVLGAAAHAYCSTWSGDLAKGELLLLDTVPLLADPQLNPLSLVQHQITLAIIKTIQGKPQQAIGILLQILDHPMFPAAPPSLQLQTYNMLLDSHIVAGNLSQIDSIAEKIRSLAIPEHNNFSRSYLNFCLAMAALATGRPHKALAHAEEAHNRSKVGKSAIAIRMCALLYGQVLSELGQQERALNHLGQWHDRWMAADYRLIAALGRLEVSKIYQQQGKLEKARKSWHQAHNLLPPGEPMYQLYQPAGFYHKLEEKLFPPEPQEIKECVHPVRIKTLGAFELEINGYKIYDRNWHGRQSKKLLKLLIAMGGKKVSTEKIAELLWPDADGDKAVNSLNVTLSRLRRVGIRNGQPSLLWLTVKHNKLSLAGNLCCTDALIFHEAINQSLKNGEDKNQLKQTLDSYTGNFLPQDTHLAEIQLFHNELLHLYTKGILQLTEHFSTKNNISEAIPYLEKASSHDPTNELLYIAQIKLYLQQNKRSKARETYHHACSSLFSQSKAKPGPELRSLVKDIEG